MGIVQKGEEPQYIKQGGGGTVTVVWQFPFKVPQILKVPF